MHRTLHVVAVIALAASAVARAAYLAGDDQPVEILRPPRPEPAVNPLTRRIQRLRVVPGHTYKGLTVYLLETDWIVHRENYRSMSEALLAKELVITEEPAASVPSVLAENKGDRAVLMLAGEIIVGGKQNRTLKDDVLLDAHATAILPVLCVERARWSGRYQPFLEGSGMASLDVRGGAISGRAQGEIWDSVSSYQRKLSVEAPTADLSAIQKSPEAARAVADYTDAFRKHWRAEAVGMVVARHGRIVGADIFCNRQIFAKHRDRLLESYALDCHVHRNDVIRHHQQDAAQFLARVHRAQFTWREAAGRGRILAVSAGITGHALTLGEDIVHAGLFPERPPVPIVRPMPEPIPMPMPEPLPPIR